MIGKTTPSDDQTVTRTVMRSPMSSCKKIQATLRLKGTEVSSSTSQQAIWAEVPQENGLCQTASPLDSRAEEESVVLGRIHHATVCTSQQAH